MIHRKEGVAMYIGKLNTKLSGLAGSYKFTYRGTSHPFPPDKIFNSYDTDNGVISFESCSLCQNTPVGWKWDSLMDVGLDIRINFSKECFIGAVCIGLLEGSAVQAVEVFKEISNNRKYKPADNLVCIGRYDAQTNGLLEGNFTIPVGVNAEILLIRFKSCLKDIVLARLDVIGAVPDNNPIVYPTPAKAVYQQQAISLSDLQSIVADDGSKDSDFAVEYLRGRLLERFSVDLPVKKAKEKVISISICKDIPPEGYKITIGNDRVKLSASNRLCLLYAVETLIQLCNNGKLPVCKIEDHPYMPLRGFHFGLPPREEMEFAKRLIKYVLIPMKYNTLFIEFAGGMRFEKHPEISEAWVQGNRAGKAGSQPAFPHGEMVSGGELLEKDEVRDFIEYVRSFGFEIIPEVQSFGHVQYITYAHPDIAEVEEISESNIDKKTDTRSADQPPSKFYHHSYCSSNEKSYEIIFDIIDEIIEVVKPERYVHMGHDEIYQIGLCPRCKGKDHSDLYATHVTRMYNYLK
jgi:hypothetical protein